MICVIQRALQASVSIEGRNTASIGKGLVVLTGIEHADGMEDVEWMSSKIINLRIFNDDGGVMNLSVKEIAGDLLVVSQFTLHASTKKGNRPSYIQAAKPEVAIPVYENFKKALEATLGTCIKSGVFGADMQVSLVNDGPVTIIINSKDRR